MNYQDDPRFTAYALGELPADEIAEVEAILAGDAAARAYIEEIRATAGKLQKALHEEMAKLPLAPITLKQQRFWTGRRIGLAVGVAAAACVAVAVVVPTLSRARSGREGMYAINSNPTITSANRSIDEVRLSTEATGQTITPLQPSSSVTSSHAPAYQKAMVDDNSPRPSAAVATSSDLLPTVALDATLSPVGTKDQRMAAVSGVESAYDRLASINAQINSYRKSGQANQETITRLERQADELVRKMSEGKGKTVRTVRMGELYGSDEARKAGEGVATERALPLDFQAVQARLDRKLPELRFDGANLGEAIEFFSDVSGTPIYVNWDELRSAGVTKATPVTYRGKDVRFSAALEAVLKAACGGGVLIGFEEGDGFIQIDRADRLGEAFNTESYDRITDNPFLAVAENPLSTFSVDVDTASYSNLRRFLTMNQLPPKDAVRIEEMVNYFPYDYAPPTDGKPFATHMELSVCPWNEKHQLLRIGIKGQEIAQDKRPPSNLVFLLDVSGSMDSPNKLPLVKRSMKALIEKLGENDRVAIVVYAGSSGLVLSSTPATDKARIAAAIDELSPGGSTNGAQGIELAYAMAKDHFIKDGTNRVILCTDGDFNVGVTDQGSLTRLIEEKAKSGVFLSVLGFGMGNTKDSTMEKLADKGNGNYAYIDTYNEARKVLVEQMSGTLVTIAKDVKLQLEFNPAKVSSYRLIGYENRMLAKEDFNDDKKDAGEIGAGHTVTALYEIVPAGEDPTTTPSVDPLKYQKPTEKVASDETLTLKLRYKPPTGDHSELIEFVLRDQAKPFSQASKDFQFASAVAGFGMILRESPYKGSITLDAVSEIAASSKGEDAAGYRAELVELIGKAKALKR